MQTPITIQASPEKPLEWIQAGRGIAVWQNANLSSHSIGNLVFTPARDTDGSPTKSPGWQYGHHPVHVSDNAGDFQVQSWTAVKRIKVRPGKYGPPCHPVIKADIPKLDKAMESAGPDASWRFDWQDYSCERPWAIVVIEIPAAPVPLSDAARV